MTKQKASAGVPGTGKLLHLVPKHRQIKEGATKMLVPNEELLAMREALRELGAVDPPAKVGIYIARLSRAILTEAKDVSDALDKLVRKYGNDKGHDIFTLTPPNNKEGDPVSENWDVFAKERKELLAAESDVEAKPVIWPQEVPIKVALLTMFDRWLKVEGIPDA